MTHLTMKHLTALDLVDIKDCLEHLNEQQEDMPEVFRLTELIKAVDAELKELS